MRALLAMGLAAALVAGVMAQAPAELKVGDVAPDFNLQGTDGKTHKLSDYRGKQAVVLALPRGGVVLGYEIAKALNAPLDIIATRKIGHPSSPEYAIGAVDEKGMTILNKTETATIEKEWLEKK